MGSDLIWEKLTKLSVICGMNQRYNQAYLTDAEWWSHALDVLVVITTIAGLALAIVALFRPERVVCWLRLDIWATIGASLSALAAILLLVVPVSRDVRYYGEMFQSWSDLRQEIDSVVADTEAEAPTGESEQVYLERRYRDLLSRKNSLNAREPAPEAEKLKKYLIAEQNSRQPMPEAKEAPKKSAMSPIKQALTAR